jgi:hypothetical protein
MSKYPSPILPDFFNDVEFSFQIISLRKKTVNNTSDVVTSADWKIIGKYSGVTAEHVSDAIFIFDDTTEFTPFSDLTESQVKSWIMDDEDYEFLKSAVASKLEVMIKSRQEDLEVTTTLPWS